MFGSKSDGPSWPRTSSSFIAWLHGKRERLPVGTRGTTRPLPHDFSWLSIRWCNGSRPHPTREHPSAGRIAGCACGDSRTCSTTRSSTHPRCACTLSRTPAAAPVTGCAAGLIPDRLTGLDEPLTLPPSSLSLLSSGGAGRGVTTSHFVHGTVP